MRPNMRTELRDGFPSDSAASGGKRIRVRTLAASNATLMVKALTVGSTPFGL